MAVTISKKLQEELAITEGDEVEISAENGKLIIQKSQKNTQLAMPFSPRLKLGAKVQKD